MNKSEIERCHDESQEGRLIFPEVVRRLLQAGVERYTMDYVTCDTTYYSADGDAYRFPAVLVQLPEAAATFSATALLEAIRAAQRDEIRYPEFAKRAVEAGCVVYTAFLTGQKVVYTGRTGDSHTELFPQKK